MKRISLRTLTGVMVFTLALVAASAGSSDIETPEQELPEGQARVVISVEGLTCGGCCMRATPYKSRESKTPGASSRRFRPSRSHGQHTRITSWSCERSLKSHRMQPHVSSKCACR